MFMKKCVRNVLALVLSVAMILPLAACNKGKKKGGKQKVVAEDDPYFTATEIPIDLDVDKSKKVNYQEIYNTQLAGNRLIGTYTIDYEMPEEVSNKIEDLYMNMKEGEEMEIYEQIEAIYSEYSSTGLIMFDMEGNIIKKSTGDMTTNYTSGITPLSDGTFVALAYSYDMGECKESFTIHFLDENLEKTKEIKLDSEIEEAWGGTLYPLDNGNFIFATYSSICVIDKDGKLLGKDSVQDMDASTIYKADGKYYVSLWHYDEMTGSSKITLNEIDINTGKISTDGKKASNMLWGVKEKDGEYYYCGSNGIEKIDIFDSKKEKEMLLEWNWTDVNHSNIDGSSLNIVSEDEIYFLKTTYEESDDPSVKYSGSKTSLVKLEREKKNPHAGKTILQIGAMNLYDNKFMDYIVSYNTDKSNKCRILVKDYSEDMYSEEEDYTKATKEMADKVYLEMIAGEGPDILLNFSSFSQFNNEDVLLDLNTLIDGENGFNRDDYFDNVLRAFETKGKMYQIPVCVDIHGFLANRDFVGDRTSWNYDDFMQIGKSLPEDVSMMEETTCANLLESLISVSGDTFIDYENKKVNFDSEEFRQALEIAKTFGVLHLSMDEGGYVVYDGVMGGGEYVDPIEKVKNGMMAMTSVYFYSLQQYAQYYSALKEKSVFLGAPAPESSGMSAQPMMTLAIAKSCSAQDEAWDFIRFMFEEDQQISYAYSFYSVPILRSALEEKNKKDIKQFEEEKENVKQWDPEYFENYYNFDLDQEMADGFIKLIEGVRTITSTDPGIMMIVNEEAPGFFENQRSAEDVCKNIQNRATTLLHER